MTARAEVLAAVKRVGEYLDAVPTLYDDENPMHPELVLDTATNWTDMSKTTSHDLSLADVTLITAALADQEGEPEVALLERCRRCLVSCEPGMACVRDHPDEDAERPCRPVAQEGERDWPACRTYPNLGCVCRGAGSGNSGAPCLRERTGDLTPIPLAAQEGERGGAADFAATLRAESVRRVDDHYVHHAVIRDEMRRMADTIERWERGEFKPAQEGERGGAEQPWPFGAEQAARLIASVSWPNEREENRDGWAVRMLTDRPELLDTEAPRARARLEAAICAVRARIGDQS